MALAKLGALAVVGAGVLGIGLLAWAGAGSDSGTDAASPAAFVQLPQSSDGLERGARPQATPAARDRPAEAMLPASPGSVPPEDPYAG